MLSDVRYLVNLTEALTKLNSAMDHLSSATFQCIPVKLETGAARHGLAKLELQLASAQMELQKKIEGV